MQRSFKFNAVALLLSVFSLFIACTDGDDYLFDSNEAIPVSVSARMALSIDSINALIKADTVRPEDTVIFIADVNPSKSIHMQKYYWTLDGEVFATEFSFRKNIEEPGEHHITLVLIDFFGDTLTDTLTLWVGNPPILDTLISIPADESQEIPAEGPFSFAWHGFDPDSLYSVHYSFVLTTINGDTLIDTVSKENFFTYENKLTPLECYQWEVTAINQLNFQSENAFKKSFCTKDEKGEAAVEGFIRTSEYGLREQNLLENIEVMILDFDSNIVKQEKVQGYSNELIPFRISSIPEGTYLITAASSKGATDFKCDTTRIRLRTSQVYYLDSLLFKDSTPPTIRFISENSADTIDYADTLRFIVKDEGSPSSINTNTKAYLENNLIKNSIVRGDTILLALPELADAWNLRLVSITAQDFSGNSRTKAFYVRPSVKWFEINEDIIITDQDNVYAFIKDVNPFGFKPQAFVFSISNDPKAEPYQFDADGDREIAINIPVTLLTDDSINAYSQIRYTNGIIQTKQWTITRKTSEADDE